MTPPGNHPRQAIPLMKPGDTRIGSASFHNQIISTCNAIRRLKIVSGSNNEFLLSDDNATLALSANGGRSGSGTGWTWAEPKEFDLNAEYQVEEVVVVVAGGAATGGADPGTYVCIQTVAGGITAQLPINPPPDSDPDGVTNFWWPLGGGTSGGWHWAATPEFATATAYSVDEVVTVTPGNGAIGTTVATGKKVVAGTYVCIAATTGSTATTYPSWPVNGYWQLVSFWPSTVVYCVDGVDTNYYVNAQPK